MQINNQTYVSIHWKKILIFFKGKWLQNKNKTKKYMLSKFVNLNVAKINWLQPLTLNKIVFIFSVLLWNCEI